MTCETCRNRILAATEPGQSLGDLSSHLAECAPCQMFQAQLDLLNTRLTKLPVPRSDKAKEALLTRIAAAEPIIAARPKQAKGNSKSAIIALVSRAGRRAYAGALVAGLLLAVAAWWSFRGTTTTNSPREVALGHHELLDRQVKHTVALTAAKTPQERVVVWANVAADLGVEARYIHKAAKIEDMSHLEKMYSRTLTEGVVRQATQLPNHLTIADRRTILEPIDAQLAAVETDVSKLEQEAQPQAKAGLTRMLKATKEARTRIQSLAAGEGV